MGRSNAQKFRPLTFVIDENSTGLSASTSSFPAESSVTSVEALGLGNKRTPDSSVIKEITKKFGTRVALVTADKQKDLKSVANTAGVTTIIFSRNNSGTAVQGQLLKKLWRTPGFRAHGYIADDYTEIKLNKDSVTYRKRSGKQGTKKLHEAFKHRSSGDILSSEE